MSAPVHGSGWRCIASVAAQRPACPNLCMIAAERPPLLQASRPADAAEQTRLQTQAFEAINEVVRASAGDTTPMVVQLIPLVVGKLQETLHMQGGGLEAAERQSEIQVCVCVLVVVVFPAPAPLVVGQGCQCHACPSCPSRADC